jgi:hypothetical protein
MGLKTDNSPVDVQLPKMEATIENIASFTIVGNLVVNELMECKAIASKEKPKWTMVMAKNVH